MRHVTSASWMRNSPHRGPTVGIGRACGKPLQAPQQQASFQPRVGREGRGFHLAIQPNQGTVGRGHPETLCRYWHMSNPTSLGAAA